MAAAAPFVIAGPNVYEFVGCYDEYGVFHRAGCGPHGQKPCGPKNTDTMARQPALSDGSAPRGSGLSVGPQGEPMSSRLTPLNFGDLAQSGDDGFPVTPNYPSLPPWLYQPTTGLPFNPSTYVTIPAIGATATIIDFVVPNGYNGVINQLGNNFVGGGFVDGSGNLKWQLLIDGVPYPNFDNIISSLGNPASPSLIGAVNIRERQHVQLVVTNVAVVVAGQLIGGRLSGWYFPLDLADTTQWF